ncbi:hypothetical protein JHK85_010437 [Glycine max]|uniref:Uncharacterized protein n=1 Tax=Glycine soja TaxID=3848 RepID=A0A0B2R642_GLYSO|nr:hypothetical protein JHK87_010038 [Glycine soja]KAG5049334.1 hypothetical protein JHK85_010437 [Glycine max]KAG5066436.1 hypothetical protein JHK86_010167 [Glycine max]KHN29811.1 hypothetical protein glysoja_041122 [Glycine soja]
MLCKKNWDHQMLLVLARQKSNLFNKLQVKFAIQYMRRVIQKKEKFDITDLITIKEFVMKGICTTCFIA